ncbi:MAG TPA: hypothetical protein ENK18_15130 [Deltaproteobacteria bacterium]|nr:hypothetical protein [Deltaproteobacteria bacterium]
MDLRARRFRDREGGEARLSQREADLLRLLASRGTVVPRDELLRELWGWRGGGETRAVDAAVRRLRVKIEPDPSAPSCLLRVYGEGYRLVAAPVRAPPAAAGSTEPLPRPLAPVLGRSALLASIHGAIDAGRPLITLVGPGGIGKTRLAIEVARRIAPSRRVLFVELEACQTVDEARHRVAAALGTSLPAAADPDRALAEAAHEPLLLVLDNLEQIAHVLAESLPIWLGAGSLQILATSREAVALPGECILDVEPLGPEEAGALYAQRAEAAGRRPDRDEARAVTALVSQLEGNPLAIELAAAWAPVLEPAEVHRRLLAGGLEDPGRGRVARHASLDAVVRWSWELLGEPERRVLEACSLFPAGFTPSAVAAILEGEEALEPLLLGLRRKSLLLPAPGPGRRLTTTGVVRRFAARAREGRGDDTLSLRFASWCADRAVELGRRFAQAEGPQTLASLLADLGNFVAGLDSLDNPRAVEVVLALGPALEGAGWFRIHVATIDAALARSGPIEALHRALLLQRSASMTLAIGDLDQARRRIAAAGQAADEVGDPVLRAEVLLDRGGVEVLAGDLQGCRDSTNEAIALLETIGGELPRRRGRAWMFAGANHTDLGEPQRARDCYERALTAFGADGSDRGRAAALIRLANLDLDDGGLQRAEERLQQAEALLSTYGPRGRTAALLRVRGLLAELHGDLAAAERDQLEVLELSVAAGEPWTQYDARLALARCALARRDPRGALEQVQPAVDFAESHGWIAGWITAITLQGLARVYLGQEARARAVLATLRREPQAAAAIHFLEAILDDAPIPSTSGDPSLHRLGALAQQLRCSPGDRGGR